MNHVVAMDNSLDKILYQVPEQIVNTLTRQNSDDGLSQASKDVYRTVVRQYNQFIASNHLPVNEQSVEDFFKSISHLAPATQNLKKFALLKVLKEAFGKDNILMSVAIERAIKRRVKSHKIDSMVDDNQCLSESDVKQLIKFAPSVRVGFIIKFLFVTGCRVTEMINIRLKDIEPVNGMAKIRIVGKGAKERFAYVPKALMQEIKSEYNEHEYLFESRNGKKLHRINVTNAIKRAGKNAELGNVSAHSLRHARATDMLRAKGVSLKAVSRHLGHSTTATTADMYIHDSVDYRQLFSRDTI